MTNWRRPVLKLYDERIAKSPIPRCRTLIADFYALPGEARQSLRAQRLMQLLRHAARHVPHYRKLLVDREIVRGDVIDLDRFGDLPPLSRSVLQSSYETLKSDDLGSRHWYKNSSGGSTGEPVAVVQDQDYNAMGIAMTETHLAWSGRESGESMIKLWGSDRDVLSGTLGWRNKFSGFIRNHRWANSFKMSESAMLRYLKWIKQHRPVLIEAYADSAFELARFANARGTQISGVRHVITSAGTLHPSMREEISRAFGCPTLNRYGCREVGDIAGERAENGGLEVFDYCNLVEVVKADGRPCQEGEEGDVLVTNLTNFAMPLIRYRLGDRAVVDKLSDGPLTCVERLQTVSGRSTDAFIMKDGSTVPGYFFVHFLAVVHEAGWLRKTHIVQRDYDDVVVKMVVKTAPVQSALDEIVGSLRIVLGQSCNISFETLNDIPAMKSGKYSYVVSHVNRP
jgi:phenylacetate-CoA ligase